MSNLVEFIRESNRIEGYKHGPTEAEVAAHNELLALDELTVPDLEKFVDTITDDGPGDLRDKLGMDVRVGRYIPPQGGPEVRKRLEDLLFMCQPSDPGDVVLLTPYEMHRDYETLHPFMDGNGRSGRAIWAWMMQREGKDPFAMRFLHRWYYQSLDASR